MKISFPRIAALLLCLLVPVALCGQAVPPGGVSVLSENPLTAFHLTGQTNAARVETVAVKNQSFSSALRVQTLTPTAQEYSVQLSAPIATAVKRGDVLLATFFLRRVSGGGESGEGKTAFIFELAREPYSKSADYPAAAPPGDWKRFDVPFDADADFAPGEAQINFHLGFAPQTIEIGGVSVVNYGTKVALKDLPQTKLTYAGREENAAWRKAAAARIEKIRKGNLTVKVVDANGKPIPNATVHVKMTRHAFGFGSAVTAQMLTEESADAEKYRKIVFENFSKVVFENDLKWPQWEEPGDKERAKAALKILSDHKIAVRGHNLIWPSWRNSPRDLREAASDPIGLHRRIETHITSEAAALKGQLAEWDVVNEPFDNHDVTDILGRQSLIDWYKLARQADPKPILFLNDYPPLDGRLTGNAHLNSFYDNLKYLKDNDAPLGGIGFQCHFGRNVIPPPALLLGLDRFGKLGLPIETTEFDINTTDAALQADYTRDFLTALFSHPAVNGIIMWGFWEGRHWLPDAALYRRDWTLKPNGKAWLDLVTKAWWTNKTVKTNASGKTTTRGFLGDYLLTATAGNKTKTVTAKLVKTGATVTITLK